MKYPNTIDHDFRVGDFVRYIHVPCKEPDSGRDIETMEGYRDNLTTLTVTRVKPNGYVVARATDSRWSYSYYPGTLIKLSLARIRTRVWLDRGFPKADRG